MEITDFSKGSLWAIHPKSLNKMLDTLPNLKDLGKEAINFTPEPKERDDFLLRDGVAIIPVTGVLSKRMTFWSWLFGGSSYIALAEIYSSALNDPDVEGILLDMDTPGGTVNGVEAFGNLVYASREVKPVAAFGNGMITSAGYWIASATKKIIVEQTTDVGSIGVLMVHQDWSKFDDKMGIKRTVLSSGKYKALGNDSEPLSDLARETFQQELDYIYTQFVDVVARNRGVDSQAVIDNMADGRVFIGQQAVDAGLADMTGSLETAIGAVQSLIESSRKYFFIPSGIDPPEIIKEEIMATKPFMVQVDEHVALYGCSKLVAMQAVMKKDPKAHEDYINSMQPGPAIQGEAINQRKKFSTKEISNEKPFLDQVAEYRQVRGFRPSRTEAMQAILKTPAGQKAHREYIASVNS